MSLCGVSYSIDLNNRIYPYYLKYIYIFNQTKQFQNEVLKFSFVKIERFMIFFWKLVSSRIYLKILVK